MNALSSFVDWVESEEPGAVGVLWWLVVPLVLAVALVVTFRVAPGFYQVWIDNETGLLELAHVAIAFTAFVVALRLLGERALWQRPWLAAWTAILALGSLYIAGEEASWGQWFFGWATPESWSALNDQSETNLHNVSSWLDQKPRALLELGVIVGGILIPLAARFRPAILRTRLSIVLPPFLVLPCAVLAEASRIPERLRDFVDTGLVVFPRASEVQELYFYLFILFYVIVLRRRILKGPGPAA